MVMPCRGGNIWEKMEAISVFIIRIVELWYALTVEYQVAMKKNEADTDVLLQKNLKIVYVKKQDIDQYV